MQGGEASTYLTLVATASASLVEQRQVVPGPIWKWSVTVVQKLSVRSSSSSSRYGNDLSQWCKIICPVRNQIQRFVFQMTQPPLGLMQKMQNKYWKTGKFKFLWKCKKFKRLWESRSFCKKMKKQTRWSSNWVLSLSLPLDVSSLSLVEQELSSKERTLETDWTLNSKVSQALRNILQSKSAP